MIEGIADLYKAVKDRLGNPLLTSFVISWCLVNYKFFVVIFSDNTVTTTFALIEEICFPSLWTKVSRGFLLPFFLSMIYIFALPYPMRQIYIFQRSQLRRQKEALDELDRLVLLTREEAAALRASWFKAQEEFEGTIDRQQAEIDRLRTLQQKLPTSEAGGGEPENESAGVNASSEIDVAAPKDGLEEQNTPTAQEISASMTPAERKMLRKVGDAGLTNVPHLINEFGGRLKTEAVAESLIQKKLLIGVPEKTVRATSLGRRVALLEI